MHIMRVKPYDYRLVRFLALVKVQIGVILGAAILGILLADATGHSYPEQALPNGKISLKAVSWKLVKQLAEPNAGLSGHKVTILNPANRSVIAAGKTDSSGFVEFDIPPGTYTLLGASDEPETVQVRAGQTAKFKLIEH